MVQQVVMPQLGESVVEGRIVAFFVKVGDEVQQGTPLLEVETDKANTEVTSNASGFVSRLLVAEGATVDVGAAVVEVSDAPPQAGARPDTVSTSSQPSVRPESPTIPAFQSEDDREATRVVTSAERDETPTATRPRFETSSDRPWNANNIVAAPTSTTATLPMAQRSPSGTAAVEAVAAAFGAPQSSAGPLGAPTGMRHYRPAPIKAGPDDTVIPFSKRRSIIAEHMVYSKHVSPHVPCFAEVDVSAAMDLRARHVARLKKEGASVSLLAFVLKATCDALREFPSMNAVVGDEEIIQRAQVNLGVAVETDGGLLVPVIRDADAMSAVELAAAVSDVADRARSKRISADDLSGGTFTISNPGRRGNLFGAAIINQPQVGILRMGEMVRRAVVREVDGEEVICIRSMMFLGLSYDHRIVDGVTANGFLYRVRELIEAAAFDV